MIMTQIPSGLLRLAEMGSSIQMISWSPDSRWLAIYAEDLLVMNVEAWEIQYRWCLNKPLVFLGFLKQPSMLAFGSPDGEITLLHIEPARHT